MKRLFIIFFIFIAFTTYSFAQEYAIIANKSVSESSIDKGTLAKIMDLNTTTWSNGSKIVIFDYKDNAAKSSYYSYIGRSENALKKLWLKKKLTEGATTPIQVSDDNEMLNKVASTSGALGYIPASKVNDSVKVLGKF